jgi:receptor protein-tyrosine kinase
MLEGRADLGVVRAVPQVPGLFVLPAGALPPHPLELIERPAFAHLLAELAQRFAHVVLDTPALGRAADAAVLAGHAQQTLLVLRQHHSSHRAVQAGVQALARHGATLGGVMLNGH